VQAVVGEQPGAAERRLVVDPVEPALVVRAIVLVGGEGTRLRPLTYTTPKPLLPVANEPFLDRQLSWLAAHGVDEVGLSLGYLPDAFVAHYPDGRFTAEGGQEVALHYAPEPVPLGTAGATRFAAERLGTDERFVVCNGDVLTGLDLGALVEFHDQRGAEATIHLAEVDDPSRFGVVPTFEDGEVKAFVEKPPPGSAPTRWINAGTYVLEPSVLDRIPAGLTVSIERETFPRMLEERGRVFAMPSDAYWIDIGTAAQYLKVHADALAGCLGPRPVADAEQVAPGVWVQGPGTGSGFAAAALLGAGTALDDGARVTGSVLGAGVRVSAGATVRGSGLHDRVVVGPDARVTDSIVGAGAVIGTGASVDRQSIVGAGAAVEAGAVLVGEHLPAADALPTRS
jgi:NDP-sugar pyrophosphorylase family protein